eukprot:2071756-Pleurochrysis_carterae.AAC.1
MQEERDASRDTVTALEANITKLQRMINRANAVARAANKENAAAVTELEAQAEEALRVLQKQIDQQIKELSVRSQKVAKERQELAVLRFRCKELQAKNADYQ